MTTASGGVPPGFRFHPTDEELLHYYLRKKVSFQKFDMEVIREVDLNKMEPWELQERCRIGSTPQNEWYFFSHKDRKYPTGSRTNRATNAGFWKATGRDKCIRNTYKKIGMRKTLVFYRGRAPHGQKTDWIMHEYRLEDAAAETDDAHQLNSNEDGWVVCRVFKKKNLFKIGNDHQNSSNINSSSSDHHHYSFNGHNSIHNAHLLSRTGASSTSAFLQRENEYLLRGQHPELALHYSATTHQMLPITPTTPYSLFQPQTQTQTLSLPNNNSSSHHQGGGGGCDQPGLEVAGTTSCEPPTATHGGHQDHQAAGGLSDWTMLVADHQPDSSRGVARFEDAANPQHQIHQLSLRGEMNFWGYEK